MSETAVNIPENPRRRRPWILMISLILCVPLIFFVVMALVYSRLAVQEQLADVRAARDRALMTIAAGGMSAPQYTPVPATAPDSLAKALPPVVRVEVQFEGFEIRTADALVIERESGRTYLISPLETFAPVTGKLNGRMVTREAGDIFIIAHGMPPEMPGMGPVAPMSMAAGGAAMAGPGTGSAGGFFYPPTKVTAKLFRKSIESGFAILATDSSFEPIRVLGDSPIASAGDTLVVASGQLMIPQAQLTVLGTDESITTTRGQQKLDHLLKLTRWSGDIGAVVCNTKGDPIGMIVYTTSGQDPLRYSYAVPMDQLFHAYYEWDGTGGNRPASTKADSFGESDPAVPELTIPAIGDEATPTVPLPSGRSNPVAAPGVRTTDDASVDAASPLDAPVADKGTIVRDQRLPTTDVLPPNATAEFLAPPRVDPAGSSAAKDDAELNGAARRLALRIRSAAPAEQQALRRELEQLTTRHFELRQAHRKQELDALSERIDKLRLIHLRRQQNKSEVIQRRVRDLLDPNADLQWQQEQVSRSVTTGGQSVDVAGTGSEVPLAAPVVAAANGPPPQSAAMGEKTFDGIPYSQWLTMLESERKPLKLASAMEACSRLAAPADERRVARGILRAAGFINVGESDQEATIPTTANQDVEQVWTAALLALHRLPPKVVAEEVVVALRDPDSSPAGRTFQGMFIAEHPLKAVRDAWKSRDQEIVRDLLRLARQKNQGSDWMLAAACSIWRYSGRPAADFEGLIPQVMQMIDETGDAFEGGSLRQGWVIAVKSTVELSPDTPDLADKLMRYLPQAPSVREMIGKLGRHAEPVVPRIVDEILDRWQRIGKVAQPGNVDEICESIKLLGQIGVGENGRELLTELMLVGSPRADIHIPDPAGQWTVGSAIDEAVEALRQFETVPIDDSTQLLLSDLTMISGAWHLESTSTEEIPTNRYAVFDRGGQGMVWVNALKNGYSYAEPDDNTEHTHLGLRYYSIDPAKKPKRISLAKSSNDFEAGRRFEGIYELTRRNLRIQISGMGQPCPAEFAKDRSSLPEGHRLLVFGRVPAVELDSAEETSPAVPPSR